MKGERIISVETIVKLEEWEAENLLEFGLAFKALHAACAEFVRKVEAGEAKSKRSYAQMKDALTLAAPFTTPLREDT